MGEASRAAPSFLASRGFAAQRSRASALPLLNLKKKRDCSQSIIITETRREKTDCRLLYSKQTLRQPRNGVTDWSIAQLLTDH